jgi:multisubunit Na+/H+ antiporter MnhC subunit
MVNPLYLIALFLASAFAIALFDKVKREIGLGLLYATLAAALVLVGFRLWELSQNPALQSQFFTAGFEVPLPSASVLAFRKSSC